MIKNILLLHLHLHIIAEGTIVLHKLAHLINEFGYDAYLYHYKIDKKAILKLIRIIIRL